MNNLIYYKYKNKEISTPHKEGYLTNFKKTNDWIEWLQKEFEISEEDFETEQFKIQFKSKNQPEYIKLFYADKEAEEAGWEMDEDGKKDSNMIFWPPIYLHPIVENTISILCSKCGNKQCYDNRKLHEFFQKEQENCYDWEKGDNVYITKCDKCGFVGGIFKKCSYRICEDHDHGQVGQWWKDVWKKLGVNPNPIVREFKEYE